MQGSMLERIIQILQDAIGTFVNIFIDFGGAIILILLIIEVLRSAIDLSTGKGFTLDIKFYTYIGLVVFMARFETIYKAIVKSVVIETNLQANFEAVFKYVKNRHVAAISKPNPRGIGGFINFLTGIDLSDFDGVYVARYFLTAISFFVCFFLLILIVYFITKSFAIFLLQLALGPVPIALMLTPETRDTGIQWIKVIFSRFLTFTLYSIVLGLSVKFIHREGFTIYESAGGNINIISDVIPAFILLFLILFLFRILSKLPDRLIN